MATRAIRRRGYLRTAQDFWRSRAAQHVDLKSSLETVLSLEKHTRMELIFQAGSCPLRGSKIWNGSSSESYRSDAWWRHARNTTGAWSTVVEHWGAGDFYGFVQSFFKIYFSCLLVGLYFCHQDPWAETLVPRSLGNFTIHDPSGSSTQCDSFQCCNLCLWSQWILGRCIEMHWRSESVVFGDPSERRTSSNLNFHNFWHLAKGTWTWWLLKNI